MHYSKCAFQLQLHFECNYISITVTIKITIRVIEDAAGTKVIKLRLQLYTESNRLGLQLHEKRNQLLIN